MVVVKELGVLTLEMTIDCLNQCLSNWSLILDICLNLVNPKTSHFCTSKKQFYLIELKRYHVSIVKDKCMRTTEFLFFLYPAFTLNVSEIFLDLHFLVH